MVVVLMNRLSQVRLVLWFLFFLSDTGVVMTTSDFTSSHSELVLIGKICK